MILPPVAALEMTWRCNHACLFCSCPWYARNTTYPCSPELTTGEWIEAIGKLVAAGVSTISLTGGESLLREDLPEILEAVAKLRPAAPGQPGLRRIHLLSNGKLMEDSVLELCLRLDITLAMSLPGLRAFPELTGGGDPANVLHWLERAREAGLRPTAGITITRRNLHEIRETAAAALLAGAARLLINRYTPGGRGLSHPDLVVTTQELLWALGEVDEVLALADRPGFVGTELPLCHVDAERFPRLRIGSRCAAATGFFAVDPGGWIRTCNHSPVRTVHLSRLEELEAHPYWRTFALSDFTPDACMECGANARCHSGCRESAHILRGEPWSEDPAFPPRPLPACAAGI